MRIGGLQKLSLIDYPGKLSSILFTQGCVFKCHYCHNPSLVQKPFSNIIPEDEIFRFLLKRKNFIDAVVISGGEPTIHKDLITFIKKIKDLNYLVKLDTAGIKPEIIETLLKEKLIDYIAMDIKGSFITYPKITQKPVLKENILKSIEIIKTSRIGYEFRTTVLPYFHNKEEISHIAEMIKGSKLYILQNFIPDRTLSSSFQNKPSFSKEELLELKEEILPFVDAVEIR